MPTPDAPVPLSVLDLVPLVSGSTPAEALRNCLDLARERLRLRESGGRIYDLDVVGRPDTFPGAGGAVRAFVVLVPGDGELLLENIAVDPAEQGRGLGRLLLDLAERRAVALGATSVCLFTHVSMTENQRIYTARGYVETGRRGEDGLKRVFYRKRLLPGDIAPH